MSKETLCKHLIGGEGKGRRRSTGKSCGLVWAEGREKCWADRSGIGKAVVGLCQGPGGDDGWCDLLLFGNAELGASRKW
jgi:hypothetical protein